MRRLFTLNGRLPIKWKLTIWSAVLLFLLFLVYNVVQYVFIERWMLEEERRSMQQSMRRVLNYVLENELSFREKHMEQAKSFLDKANDQNQSIRVLDAEGRTLATAANNMPQEWLDAIPSPASIRDSETFFHDRLLIMRRPITVFEFSGAVEIVKNTEHIEQLIQAFSRVMLLCGVGAIVISGLGGWLLARQVLKPLQSMTEAIGKIKREGLHQRVKVNGSGDEIATLMTMFNRMMDQVELSFRQQRQFVEDASHELRTPITIIEGHLSLLQRWGKRDPDILEESLDISRQELNRLRGLVEELLLLTRAEEEQSGERAPYVKAGPVIREAVRHFAVLYPTFRFEVELGPELDSHHMEIAEEHLEQMMLIVLDNAAKYSPDEQKIRISGSLSEGWAEVEIADWGIGIPESDLPYVLDRFYRVDKARSREQGGHGLGLAIAKRLANRYGGEISIRSTLGEGTTVKLRFPVTV